MNGATFKAYLAANLNLQNLVFTAVHLIFIALIFEFFAWFLGRAIEKMVAPLLPLGGTREAGWRQRRQMTLRQTPKLITRSLCYTVALLLVFDLFGVPVLPLSIAVGAVALLFGAALLPVLRDLAQGYTLLAEDALAVGDVVEINGQQGTIEKFTLRGAWLRDEMGRAHCLSNRDIHNVAVLQRRQETQGASNAPAATNVAAFDPLHAAPRPSNKNKTAPLK